jgi:hypothetical protein
MQESYMTELRFNAILYVCLMVSILLSGRPSFSETTISEQILSSDIVIEDVFEPGIGLPVGKIQSMQGEAIVFHRDPTVGYRLRTGLPLYVGDIMRTRGTARILCRLIDGSRVVLAPETTLTIVQSRYIPTRKTGVSFLYLKHGNARFTLSPPSDLSAYDFKVQTDMVFVLAREADFVVKTSSEATDIIAFENSQLEVTGMAQPEDVISLSGLQRTFVSGKIISPTVETLSREDIATVMADFHSAPQITLLADGANEKVEDTISEETMAEEGIIETELTE